MGSIDFTPANGAKIVVSPKLTPEQLMTAGNTSQIQQAIDQGKQAVAINQIYAPWLPPGATYVPVPQGYPLGLILPYITKEGYLQIPQGQGVLTDDEIGWVMTAMQPVINQLAKKPYNINFVDYNNAGQIDNSGKQIIMDATNPAYLAYHKGESPTQKGVAADGFPNYDFLSFPAIYANVDQHSGIFNTITSIFSQIPVIGAIIGPVKNAVLQDQANSAKENSGISGGLGSENIPQLGNGGLFSGNSLAPIFVLIIAFIVIIYFIFKKSK